MSEVIACQVSAGNVMVMPIMDAIRAESVIKEYGRVKALKDANISIAKGELFFLLGSSGCGKTTLLRCIAGLEKPTSGRILFGDKDMTNVPTHKREAAMMFQNYALWPHMSVGENIAFGLKERKINSKEIKKRVTEALAMVRLEGYENRRINQMSGGQQQRVALARALVVKPTCLLLDEPLSNLDAKLRMEMRGEIRRIVKESKLTAVYVTHDQEEALSMADRIAILDNGKIVQIGTPQEIYRRPVNSHVANFIGTTNLIEAKVVQLIWRRTNGNEFLNVSVNSAAGKFEGHVVIRNWKPKPGEKVLISIRPEAFHNHYGGVPVNRLQGNIEGRTYLGSQVQYSVRGEGNKLWHVTELNPHVMRKIGDFITLSVNHSDVVVLKS